jgi:hypothetical protein
MEERPTYLFPPLGAYIWFGAFLMPPIPTVLVHSFLFRLAYNNFDGQFIDMSAHT